MIFIQENVLLAPKTTFEVGGVARYFVTVNNSKELIQSIEFAREKGLPFLIFGGGSNVLFSDEMFEGVVIQITSNDLLKRGEQEIVADAGVQLKELIDFAIENELGGMENMYGIPGSVGGAVRGNAGAFGTEIKDVIKEVVALNVETFEIKHFSQQECEFEYRGSFFKKNPQWIILNATLTLNPANKSALRKKADEIWNERNKRHLQDVKAAGSFFKNPQAPEQVIELFEKEKGVKSREGRVPAGWLIEKVGFKGKSVGGALCSEMHPNYILNTGTATTQDILKLAESIKDAVKAEFGIELEEEVKLIEL